MPQQATDNVKCLHCGRSNFIIVVLLAGILATQIIMLQRMPAPLPTLGAIRNARTSDARVALFRSIPLVQVHGGTIDAEIQQ
jgi:hypothetical protein